jgi:hypothetical protein
VVKTRLVAGTYFAQAQAEGLDEHGLHDSQGYLAHLATRALIFIEADNPAIGLMCFVGMGMAEVSTCELGVFEGQHLTKGDPLGSFHYGGSTLLSLVPSRRAGHVRSALASGRLERALDALSVALSKREARLWAIVWTKPLEHILEALEVAA